MTGKRNRRSKAARGADAAEAVTAMAAAETGDVAATAAAVAADGSVVVTGSVINAAASDGAPVTAFVPDNAVVRRTKDGWRVGSDDLPDLTCAMILADLLAAENGMPEAPQVKPSCGPAAASEAGRLRATVGQLEHALATRIRVEQAIGVLAERHRIKPRQAFEQLREAARSRGRKVIDIAGDVVASATNPLLQLPDELSRPRSGPRRGAHQPSGAQ
jgi:hypothetical protein